MHGYVIPARLGATGLKQRVNVMRIASVIAGTVLLSAASSLAMAQLPLWLPPSLRRKHRWATPSRCRNPNWPSSRRLVPR